MICTGAITETEDGAYGPIANQVQSLHHPASSFQFDLSVEK